MSLWYLLRFQPTCSALLHCLAGLEDTRSRVTLDELNVPGEGFGGAWGWFLGVPGEVFWGYLSASQLKKHWGRKPRVSPLGEERQLGPKSKAVVGELTPGAGYPGLVAGQSGIREQKYSDARSGRDTQGPSASTAGALFA